MTPKWGQTDAVDGLKLGAIAPTGASYDAAWQLRRSVLIDPYGIDPAEATSDDATALHVVAWEGQRVVAVLLLVPRGPGECQMRQVAVLPELCRRGIGAQLVRFAEELARKRNWLRIWAEARESALSFYRSIDYRVVSEPFEHVGLPHRVVEKCLSASARP